MTHPTTAGVTASFASLGDLTLAEPGALIGFAGPRVIKDTTQAQLQEGFQTAEFLLRKGMIDRIVERKKLREELTFCLEFFVSGCKV
jgi:acetyl-CoA carboxylase carboxyl transferase subunit beta